MECYLDAFQGEVIFVLNEVHARVWGAHQANPKLVDQIKWLGYYWPAMVQNAIKVSKAWKRVKYMMILFISHSNCSILAYYLGTSIHGA